MTSLKGFRTYILAALVAIEPVLEAAVVGNVDAHQLVLKLCIAAAIAAIRTITTTPPGKKE